MLLMFIFFSLWHLADGVKRVSVMEGDSVTLHIDDIYTDRRRHYWRQRRRHYLPHRVQWFGPEDTRIAMLYQHEDDTYDIRYYNDEIFGDRLQIDNQTGSLTIRNIRTTESGLYQVKSFLFFEEELFNVTVYARLPNPVIHRDSTCSSLVSKCVLLCSVLNVSAVNLYWYKGNSLLSSVSVSDLSSSISLHLEVDYQDNDTYSCVLNNSFTSRTEHLNISQLHVCQDSVHCCGFTEAVIRLVISAVVGVATVAVLVYDITSRRAEEKRRT